MVKKLSRSSNPLFGSSGFSVLLLGGRARQQSISFIRNERTFGCGHRELALLQHRRYGPILAWGNAPGKLGKTNALRAESPRHSPETVQAPASMEQALSPSGLILCVSRGVAPGLYGIAPLARQRPPGAHFESPQPACIVFIHSGQMYPYPG